MLCFDKKHHLWVIDSIVERRSDSQARWALHNTAFLPANGHSGVTTISPVRVLVVDDFKPFRDFIISLVPTMPHLQVVGVLSDGLEAVRKARELQPDLIFLDIQLPGQNGLQAARQIREIAPNCKIIFLSQETSPDVVQEALRVGGRAYVAKIRAGRDLLAAVDAVMGDKKFVSSTLSAHNPHADDGF